MIQSNHTDDGRVDVHYNIPGFKEIQKQKVVKKRISLCDQAKNGITWDITANTNKIKARIKNVYTYMYPSQPVY